MMHKKIIRHELILVSCLLDIKGALRHGEAPFLLSAPTEHITDSLPAVQAPAINEQHRPPP